MSDACSLTNILAVYSINLPSAADRCSTDVTECSTMDPAATDVNSFSRSEKSDVATLMGREGMETVR